MSAAREKYWSAGTLKSRGWTENMITELLPRCRYMQRNGRRMRMWQKGDVLDAEQTARFAECAETAATEPAGERPTSGALGAAAEFLDAAWDEAEKPGGNTALLAQKYHEAILRQMPAAAWAERLPNGKAMSYVSGFLSIGGIKSPDKLCSSLKRFVTASPWLGKNTQSGLAAKLRDNYARLLLAAAEFAIDGFAEAQPEANVEGLLKMDSFPVQELLSHQLSYIYSVIYVPRAIRTSLKLLVALNPKDEYPEARAMKRHFVIHIGGTNTGKTYAGFQRLISAETGVYLAPLRLLALEAQETLLDSHVACSLTTGEEEDRQDTDTHVAATAEKLDLKRRFDVAVIDECQMISDRERGYAWTRAILGVLAPEVHLCTAPHAKQLLIRMINSCGDSFEVIEHQRKTPLVCMKRAMDYTDVKPGDALITFSKIGVLSVAEDLRQRGKKAAIIYGALPYSARRKQMEGFLSGETRFVVATDAIGMGLNLPIRRIIFMDTQKFDGTERRPLKPEEIQQIAGRAGRYGMYDKGYVGAVQGLAEIAAGLETEVAPLEQAVVGFSDLVMQVDFDLLEVLQVWTQMPTAEMYVKLDISRYISIISKIRETGFELTKEQELRAANIPFDETESELLELFNKFLRQYQMFGEIDRPALARRGDEAHTLPELEQYCRKLDLYFSFSKAFGCVVDAEELHELREHTAEKINEILLHNLKNNIRFCARCGAALPLHHTGRLCNACFAKSRSSFRYR